MKSLLCLAAICIALSVCSGFCFYKGVTVIVKEDGTRVIPEDCADVFDGIRHPIGSIWNSSHCMRCSCGTEGMHCCSRYGGVAAGPGCKAILDREACEYKLYKLDDPTKLC
ncbi:small serum protein 2-like [Sceloporus undulatus]|uniref:small serum protein 2-like n=1 Tax=Sceloporus undulatus TaxID=8520 RepID=UPI001C4DBF49|nr:small serum protein 2-like [Sceloporus undulatus]